VSAPLSWTALSAAQYRPEPAAQDGVHWVQVGDEMLLWSADGEPAGLQRLSASADQATGLALVLQVGRSFQDEHPEVRVLLDHGRQLIVDSGSWRGLPDELTTCWPIAPLPADVVVVDRPDPARARQDPAILALTTQLSAPALVALAREILAMNLAALATWLQPDEECSPAPDVLDEAVGRA
jgi:hypothetical protein